MGTLVRCKACGFVTEEGKLKDVCPACGVPRRMFEPYTENISPRRKWLLDLDLHPVVVHFPQAYVFTLLVISALAAVFDPWRPALAAAIRVLALTLPVVVAGAILTGLLDGRVRFRKVTTPILKKKIFWGSLFLAFSAGLFAVVLASSWPTPGLGWLALGLSFGGFACSYVLGRLGTSLLNARFPG